MRLKDKVAIVTGAGSGFGAGIAERFAEEGARVVVNDINADGGAATVDAIGKATGDAERAFFHGADVSKNAEVGALVQAALDRFGDLDIFVNNAGVSHRNQPMIEVDEATFDKIFAVNVKSIYLSALHAVPVFKKRGGGVFINIASTAGVRPRPGLTWYNGSKGAAVILTKSMAVELAPDAIRVCGINPGIGDRRVLPVDRDVPVRVPDHLSEPLEGPERVRRDGRASTLERMAQELKLTTLIGESGLTETFMGVPDTPENRKRFEANIPLGRYSLPRDIANAALYLASDEADLLTGVCLEVDGGRCI